MFSNSINRVLGLVIGVIAERAQGLDKKALEHGAVANQLGAPTEFDGICVESPVSWPQLNGFLTFSSHAHQIGPIYSRLITADRC